MLAFWMGGACAKLSPTPPIPPRPISGGGSYDWHRVLKPDYDDDEEILELMSMITPYL